MTSPDTLESVEEEGPPEVDDEADARPPGSGTHGDGEAAEYADADEAAAAGGGGEVRLAAPELLASVSTLKVADLKEPQVARHTFAAAATQKTTAAQGGAARNQGDDLRVQVLPAAVANKKQACGEGSSRKQAGSATASMCRLSPSPVYTGRSILFA